MTKTAGNRFDVAAQVAVTTNSTPATGFGDTVAEIVSACATAVVSDSDASSAAAKRIIRFSFPGRRTGTLRRTGRIVRARTSRHANGLNLR